MSKTKKALLRAIKIRCACSSLPLSSPLSFPCNSLSIGACLQTVLDSKAKLSSFLWATCRITVKHWRNHPELVTSFELDDRNCIVSIFHFSFPTATKKTRYTSGSYIRDPNSIKLSQHTKGMYSGGTFNICSLSKLELFLKFYSSFGRKPTVVKVFIEVFVDTAIRHCKASFTNKSPLTEIEHTYLTARTSQMMV